MAASPRLLEGRERLEAAKPGALQSKLDAAELDVAGGPVVDYTPALLDEIDADEQTEYSRTHGR